MPAACRGFTDFMVMHHASSRFASRTLRSWAYAGAYVVSVVSGTALLMAAFSGQDEYPVSAAAPVLAAHTDLNQGRGL